LTESSGYVLPSDEDAERAMVGAILERPDLLVDVSAIISADDLYSSDLREIYRAALSVDADGISSDPVSVLSELRRNESRVDPILVRDLYAGGAPMPTLATSYARTVKRLSTQRQLIVRLSEAMTEATKDQANPSSIAAAVSGDVLDITAAREATATSLATLVDDAVRSLESYATGAAVTAIETGFRGIDALLGGMGRGHVIVIAARPGVGKSSLAANIAKNVADKQRLGVAFFSLEMSAFEVAMRLLCTEARVSFSAVRTNVARLDDWSNLMRAAEKLVEIPLYIDERAAIRVPDMRAAARRTPNLGLIVIDYLQLIPSTPGGRRNRQEEVAEISRGLKLLAKELDVPVLACAQLNRDPEKRADRRPQLSDLRESGSIEQDSDVVILLHRESSDPSAADAIIAKHRNGPTGTVKLSFLRELTRFRDKA